jgi:hypothetical protein
MINPRSRCAIACLDRAPTEEEAEELSGTMLPGLDPDADLSWIIADTLPPLDISGLMLSEYDQLSAHLRDTPGAVFLIVMTDGAS